jgi:hypothetical protein
MIDVRIPIPQQVVLKIYHQEDFTYPNPPKSGFMVGTDSLYEGKNPSLFYDNVYDDIYGWHKAGDGTYIGGWQDPDNVNRYCVDKSVWCKDWGTARTLAAEYNQTHIYNLSTGQVIAIKNRV